MSEQLEFASLGSGSRGNATLVRAEDTLVLVDCGFSLRETTRRMARLGVTPDQLDAILVTHEHSDHCSGVATLSRRHAVPVYLTYGTLGTGRVDGCFTYHCFHCEDELRVGNLAVKPVTVPHDAAEPCQYRFDWRDRTLGILTDLGSVTPHVVERFRGCDGLLLEFNHDLPMLLAGPYPPYLKRRVGGDWGHLSNAQAAILLAELGGQELRHLVVAHISEKNNHRTHTEAALNSVLGSLENVVFADQRDGFDWLQL